MASEIRANKQTNRVGLGTVTYTDTGIIVSGIVTANSLGGIGHLDIGSNIKIGNAGIVTASSFRGDGSQRTGITAGTSLSGSTNNTVTTVTGANAIQGEANLTFDGDTLLLKSSTDGRRVSFAGDGTSHYMKYDNTLGGIILNGYGGITFETNGTNERLRITSGGKFGFGTNSPYTHGIATFNDVNGIVLEGSSQGRLLFRHTGGGTNLKMFDIQSSDGVMKFRTIADNGTTVTERLRITSAGNVEPATDDSYDFGSLTKRWANIYTADLNLSNQGKANDVDGTWGQYTIQEGEDNLYLINKRSGKKYKFLLQEVT